MSSGSQPAAIHKVGAVLLREGGLLVVRKEGTKAFIAPGGRREPGEEALDTLRRELSEELSVELATATFFGQFSDVAAFENIPITMDVFLVTILGEPKASAEIAEIRWVSDGLNKLPLGSILSAHVIPELQRRGLLGIG